MFTLSDPEFDLLRKFLYRETGISLSDHKKALMYNRLYQRIRQLNFKTFKEYYDFIVLKRTGDELENFIDAITTNETFFFRDSQQFGYLSKEVIPDIYERKKKDAEKKFFIWSCASSTGEEPYSIAISGLEAIRKKNFFGLDFLVYATDINKTVLNMAKKGIYNSEKIKKVSPDIAKRYFDLLDDGHYQVNQSVKGKVKFSHHNLKKLFGVNKLDIVFCRNVMIYFDKVSKEEVVTNIYKSLAQGGYLFLSHSESLINDNRFKPMAPSIFKKR